MSIAKFIAQHAATSQACKKLFAKDTVFKNHLAGGKHIKNLRKLKTPFALAEADRLEAKNQMVQKLEKTNRMEAEKRKREAEEAETEQRKKKLKEDKDKAGNQASEATEEKEKIVYKVTRPHRNEYFA